MENDMKDELIRRWRAAWSAYGSLEEASDQLQNVDPGAHRFDSTVIPALCYTAETCPDTSLTTTIGQEERWDGCSETASGFVEDHLPGGLMYSSDAMYEYKLC
ncbi:hypothetical protein Q1695_002961 [Nippostrongylus brasiliensis]|nr:hypothetical protein Q1695_002961 [Nippostrongylus brasiliensis]